VTELKPPIGARVRITTTWPQGTVVIHEGIFTGWREPDWQLDGHHRVPYSDAGHADLTAFGIGGSTVVAEILELPAPEEPQNGTVLQETGTGRVWRRDDSEEYGGKHWWSDGDSDGHTWAEVSDRPNHGHVGNLVRLVQAPVVKLPWSLDSCGMNAMVAIGNEYDTVRVDIAPTAYTRAEARQIAHALLAACEVQP